MDVISNAANGNGIAFHILKKAGLISPQAITDGESNEWPAIFGGKDDVGAQYVQRLGHVMRVT